MTSNLPSKEDARLCADVVKDVARARGIVQDPAAIGRLTTAVAKLYNRGIRDRDQLLAAVMEASNAPPDFPSERA
jgi:hypothetical protein